MSDATNAPSGSPSNPANDPLLAEQRSALESESKRLQVGIIIGLVILVGVVGFAVLGGKTRDVNTLRIAVANDVKKLDPHDIEDIESGRACDLIFERLVAIGTDEAGNFEIQPELSSSWELSEDGTTYTFTLRDGATFHDGSAIDAAAVVRSLDRVRNGVDPVTKVAIGSPYAGSYAEIESVTALEDGRVEVQLSGPNSVFLYNLAMTPASIVAPAALDAFTGAAAPAAEESEEAEGDEATAEASATDEAKADDAGGTGAALEAIGSGPWQFKAWQPGQALTLDRWDAYAGSRTMPKVKRVVLTVIPEAEQQKNALLAGDIDVASYVLPEQRSQLEEADAVNTVLANVPNVTYLAMCPNPTINLPSGETAPNPMADPRLREAIALWLDKQAIVDVAYKSLGQPTDTLVPPGMAGRVTDLMSDDLATRRDRARQLIAEIVEERGEAPAITINHFTQSRGYLPAPATVVETVQAQLQELGLDVTLSNDNFQQYIDKSNAGHYAFGILGWQTDNGTVDNFLGPLVGLDGDGVPNKTNMAKWTSPEFQALLDQALRTADPAERARIYQQAERMRHAAWVNIPIAHYRYLWATRSDVNNFAVDPLARLSIDEVTIGTPAGQ